MKTYVSVLHCDLKLKSGTISDYMMFKIILLSFLIITLTQSVSGSIFTDPIKLTRLFKFQMRLSRVLRTISDDELSKLPQDVLINVFR